MLSFHVFANQNPLPRFTVHTRAAVSPFARPPISVSPLFATHTSRSQTTENSSALSPLLATHTDFVPVTPVFATHTKATGVYTNNSHSGTSVGSVVLILKHCFGSVADPPGRNTLPDDQGQREKLRLVDQSMVDGVQREFEAVGDAELVENIVEMVLDGLFGDEKFFADFLVAESLGDELHNFFFAVAEQRLFAARPGFRGLRKRLHDLGGHAIVEPDFAGVHAMNTFHQQIGSGLFQYYAA